MSDGYQVKLRVVDTDGRVIEGAQVSVVRSTVPFPEFALETDSLGEVNLILQPGGYEFGAWWADGHSSIELEINGRKVETEYTLIPAQKDAGSKGLGHQ